MNSELAAQESFDDFRELQIELFEMTLFYQFSGQQPLDGFTGNLVSRPDAVPVLARAPSCGV